MNMHFVTADQKPQQVQSIAVFTSHCCHFFISNSNLQPHMYGKHLQSRAHTSSNIMSDLCELVVGILKDTTAADLKDGNNELKRQNNELKR